MKSNIITEKRFNEWIYNLPYHTIRNDSKYRICVSIDIEKNHMIMIGFNTSFNIAGYRGITDITYVNRTTKFMKSEELFKSNNYESLCKFDIDSIIQKIRIEVIQ